MQDGWALPEPRLSLRPRKAHGVFIAATGQNNGKTTTSLAFYQHLRKIFKPLSYMKPVGQRTIELQRNTSADEDVVLMRRVFNLRRKANFMSPVTVRPGFTRQYLDGKIDNTHIFKTIVEGWNALTSGGSTVIVEGTGHAGVGSIFDANNAQVAKLLGLPVIMVTEGGIGRPLDALSVNLALFDQEGVAVKGVIFNKVQPSKKDQVREYGSKYLNKRGIEVLGVVEYSQPLSRPSLARLLIDLKAKLLSGEGRLDQVPTSIIIGASLLDYIIQKTSRRTLVVTPASRTDVISWATHNFTLQHLGKNRRQVEVIGLVLTGDQEPNKSVIDLARDSDLPIMRVREDVYETVERIHHSLAKILPGDSEKLDLVHRLYANSIQWKKIQGIIEQS